MKKTNLILIIIVILNLLILWKVWCNGCSSHNGHHQHCTAESCEDGHHGKCSPNEDSVACCKGEHKHQGEHDHSNHHHKKAHNHKHGGYANKGYQSFTTMLLKMPEDHIDDTRSWMKDSLGLSDEQIESITGSVSVILSNWENSNMAMKQEIAATDTMITNMLSPDQIKMVKGMMMMHNETGKKFMESEN